MRPRPGTLGSRRFVRSVGRDEAVGLPGRKRKGRVPTHRLPAASPPPSPPTIPKWVTGEDDLDDLEDGPLDAPESTGPKSKVTDVVLSHNLKPASTNKDVYAHHLKGYMKSMSQALKGKGTAADEIKEFEEGVISYYKNRILPDIDDFEFYTDSTEREDGLIIPCGTRKDSKTPYMVYWKHGLVKQEPVKVNA